MSGADEVPDFCDIECSPYQNVTGSDWSSDNEESHSVRGATLSNNITVDQILQDEDDDDLAGISRTFLANQQGKQSRWPSSNDSEIQTRKSLSSLLPVDCSVQKFIQICKEQHNGVYESELEKNDTPPVLDSYRSRFISFGTGSTVFGLRKNDSDGSLEVEPPFVTRDRAVLYLSKMTISRQLSTILLAIALKYEQAEAVALLLAMRGNQKALTSYYSYWFRKGSRRCIQAISQANKQSSTALGSQSSADFACTKYEEPSSSAQIGDIDKQTVEEATALNMLKKFSINVESLWTFVGALGYNYSRFAEAVLGSCIEEVDRIKLKLSSMKMNGNHDSPLNEVPEELQSNLLKIFRTTINENVTRLFNVKFIEGCPLNKMQSLLQLDDGFIGTSTVNSCLVTQMRLLAYEESRLCLCDDIICNEARELLDVYVSKIKAGISVGLAERCMACNKFLILSDIPFHEQLDRRKLSRNVCITGCEHRFHEDCLTARWHELSQSLNVGKGLDAGNTILNLNEQNETAKSFIPECLICYDDSGGDRCTAF